MNEVGLYEAMSTTRAVRRLRPDPVPTDAVERIVRAATWAPSGGNAQQWRIVVVTSGAAKRALQEIYFDLWKAYEAAHRPLLEGLPEDARAAQERMIASADHLARHLHEAPVLFVFCFRPDMLVITDSKLSRPSVVGGASIYPAVQNALLACRAEGLGCTLTTLLCEREDEVKSLLGIPDPWATAACVPVGYPQGKGHGPLRRRPPEAMAFAERWGEPLAFKSGR